MADNDYLAGHSQVTKNIMKEKTSFNPLELTSREKTEVFSQVEKYLHECGLRIVGQDSARPWGGFFVIDESQAGAFAKLFFPDVRLVDLKIGGRLSPKILLVQPQKRLSWQYHHRRAEIWRIISGRAGVATSMTDREDGGVTLKNVGDTVRLAQGQRHRLVGLLDWGVVAEIWQHTDREHPSDENDIIRLQDDFGR
jgi:mannose-6-phosphate isomerase